MIFEGGEMENDRKPLDIVVEATWLSYLLRWASIRAGDVVLVDERGAKLTYAGLVGHSGFICDLLVEEYGIEPGKNIGLHLENSLGYVPLLVSIAAVGGVTVPISTKLTFSEVDDQVRATKLKLLITEDLDLLKSAT